MQYEIEGGDYRATVTKLGAGLRELLFREQPVIAGYPRDDLPRRGRASDFRQPRPIGATRLDHALTGLARDGDGRAWTYLAAGGTRVGLWAGQGYRWLQVFTGDPLGPDRRRKAVAVEPMTCPPNAFVTGDDLLVLQPGDTVTHTWGIQAPAQ